MHLDFILFPILGRDLCLNIDAMELRGFMLNSFLKFLSIYRNDLIFENVLIFLEKNPKTLT